MEQLKRVPTFVIAPSRGGLSIRLKELWEYRELLYFLIWRDVKVRYKQTVLGAAWAIFQPLFTMAVFTLFFDRLAKVGSDGLPYPLFSLAALVPWTFFATGLTQSTNSLVGSANLIKKVYFPRSIIPAAAVLAGLVDLGLALLMFFVALAFYGWSPGFALAVLPLAVVWICLVAFGTGLWLSALNVEYRDVKFVAPFLVQIWMFVSPVIYPASRVTQALAKRGLPEWLYGLNPMAGVVEAFRYALLGTTACQASFFVAGAVVTALMLLSGIAYFKRMERTFADVV